VPNRALEAKFSEGQQKLARDRKIGGRIAEMDTGGPNSARDIQNV
jgi:hypothetical protein